MLVMLQRPKFRIRSKGWSKSCADLTSVLPEQNTDPAYKMCLSAVPSQKIIEGHSVWSREGWWRKSRELCLRSERCRESLESGYGDSTVLESHTNSLSDCSSGSLCHYLSLQLPDHPATSSHSPKCMYSCESSSDSLCYHFSHNCSRLSAKRHRDNVVHWKAKVCQCTQSWPVPTIVHCQSMSYDKLEVHGSKSLCNGILCAFCLLHTVVHLHHVFMIQDSSYLVHVYMHGHVTHSPS